MVFDEHNEAWKEEYQELLQALTPEEYEEARASTLNAFYTSPTVIRAMYEALENMGLKQGNVSLLILPTNVKLRRIRQKQ